MEHDIKRHGHCLECGRAFIPRNGSHSGKICPDCRPPRDWHPPDVATEMRDFRRVWWSGRSLRSKLKEHPCWRGVSAPFPAWALDGVPDR